MISNNNQRYQTQMKLSEIGKQGQECLANSHILVVGAGGLASPVLSYLVGAGIGHITLVDDDEVCLSNLHRQVIYRESDIGKYKVHAAAANLFELNSEVQLYPHSTKLHAANVASFVDNADIVVDCADNFAVSYILSDYCYQKNTPFISASVSAMKGYVGGFCGGAPSLRAVFPNVPTQINNCQDDGVLGSCVGIIASIQAQIVLSTVLFTLKKAKGHSHNYNHNTHTAQTLGVLTTFDASNLRFSQINFSNAPESSQEPEQAYFPFIDTSHITQDDIIIDVRDEQERNRLINDNAIYLTVNDIANTDIITNINDLKLDKKTQENQTQKNQSRVILCCQSGLRAWKAANIIQQQYQINNIALIATKASSGY